MVDLPVIVGSLVTFGLSGALGVFEVWRGLTLPSKGSRRWFLAAFALDGVVAMIAYWVLHVSLRPNFIAEPYSVYLLAVFFGVAILRVKLELLVPLGERGTRAAALLSGVRPSLLKLVGSQTAMRFAIWVQGAVVPVLHGPALEDMIRLTTTYLAGLTLSEEKAAELAKQMEDVEAKKLSDPAEAARLLSFILAYNQGLSMLQEFLARFAAPASSGAGIKPV